MASRQPFNDSASDLLPTWPLCCGQLMLHDSIRGRVKIELDHSDSNKTQVVLPTMSYELWRVNSAVV